VVLTEQAKFILNQRYLKKDKDGKVIETPEDMLWRVANTIAEVDKEYDKNTEVKSLATQFFNMMDCFDFLPATPILANIGNSLSQGSSCFVLPVYDSIDSIFTTLKHSAEIQKAGGGVGFNFSNLRPKGDYILTTMGVSSGALSFMSIFDKTVDVVKQGGIRRGAMIGILDCSHPEVIDFIKSKLDNKTLTNFNISVAVTDKFMNAVKSGDNWNFVNPRTSLNSNSTTPTLTPKASELFRLIALNAHKCADPGLFFIDTANKYYPNIEKIESTNPCGEIPLEKYDACLLGSINLGNFVDWKTNKFDEDRYKKTIRTAVHFLDNVIDLNKFPVEEINKKTRENRRLGLGVMGFADYLLKRNIPYDSKEAIVHSEMLSKILTKEACLASECLAERKGICPAVKNNKLKEDVEYLHPSFFNIRRRRNLLLTCCAPTGSISMIADCSSGIEPYFALSYRRDFLVHDNKSMIINNPKIIKFLDNITIRTKNTYDVIKETGSVSSLDYLPNGVKNVLKISQEIPYEQHIKIQAAWQKHIDSAISKCVTGDTLILTDKGIVPILSFYKQEDVKTFKSLKVDIETINGVEQTNSFYYGGVDNTINIQLRDGRKIEGTPNHKLIVANGTDIVWKELKDITEKDFVAIKLGTNLWSENNVCINFEQGFYGYQKRIEIPTHMNVDLAVLIGIYMADGYIAQSNYTITITKNDFNILNKCKRIFKEQFNLDAKIKQDGHGTNCIAVSSKSLVELLNYLGCSGLSGDKEIPWSIMQSSIECIKSFIGGVWLDGYVTTPNKNNKSKIAICLKSEKFIQQLQIILNNFGINCSICDKWNKEYERFYFELNIVGKEANKFSELFKFEQKDKQKLIELYIKNRIQHKNYRNTSDVFPCYKEKIISILRKKRSICKEYCTRATHKNKTLTWENAKKLYEKHNLDFLKFIFDNNIHFVPVKNISISKNKVYDFHVPSNNTFIGNGIINHNTINFSEDATVEDIERAYMLAYELGCKGITIYRNNSKPTQVLNLPDSKKEVFTLKKEEDIIKINVPKQEEKLDLKLVEKILKTETPKVKEMINIVPRKRPKQTKGVTERIRTSDGNLYVTVNSDDIGPCEVFIHIGKHGSDVTSWSEACGRLISLCLRAGVDIKAVSDELIGIISRPLLSNGDTILSVPDGIGKTLLKIVNGEDKKEKVMHVMESNNILGSFILPCPLCQNPLIKYEGCKKCTNCEYMSCS
jgi:ribonucleoside-diphosphate reductase alpha chain